MGMPAANPEFHKPGLQAIPKQRDRESVESAIRNFSLVLGGPVYDFLLRFGIVRTDLPNLMRRIVALIAVTWLPLLLLSLKDGIAFGHQVKIPLLYDFSIYGRFFLGLPLLLYAETVIDPAIRLGLQQFLDARIVPDEELPKFEDVLRRTQRLRDSAIPEVMLLILAFFPVFLFQQEWMAPVVSNWHTDGRGLTAAGWCFAIFSSALLRFMIYRWTFRYIVWSVLVWRIGRLRLVLMPTHPDRAAGLGFLAISQKHFGLLFCALACFFAGVVANGMVFEGVPLISFKFLMLGFVVLSVIIGVLPLTMLTPKLMQVRKEGHLEYGRLAHAYTESFDRKWVHYKERPAEELLGTSDIQSLADIGNSFGVVEKMRIAPISKRLLLQLGAQAAVPLVPVIIFGTPTPELVEAITKMIL
jgi:hypothetical protein